jgi:hypothetical protein
MRALEVDASSVTTTTRPTRPRAARIALLVTGAVSTLIAVGLLAIGGVALWADSQEDANGYFSTAGERFDTNTRALVSESLDIDLDGAESILGEGRLGTARLDVTPKGGKPVFVGIARADQVASYLHGVGHTTVTDVDFDPFQADYSRADGQRSPAPPAQQGIWAESVHGTGSQTLTWDVEDGDWSVVVMNADGSADVRTEIKAGAKVPLVSTLGWVGTAGGTLLLIAGAGLLVRGIRSPRNRSSAA